MASGAFFHQRITASQQLAKSHEEDQAIPTLRMSYWKWMRLEMKKVLAMS